MSSVTDTRPVGMAAIIRNDIAESTYQRSNVPLGKPVKQDARLRGMTHGNATQRSESVKSVQAGMADHVDTDADRQLYIKSHHAFGVSERINRNYQNFSDSAIFGCSTEHDKRGKRTKEALTIDEVPIESERVSRFIDRTHPQIGRVHDGIKDTLNVPPGHTFGAVELPDSFDAGFLIHSRPGQVQAELKDATTTVAKRVRLRLSQLNWAARFPQLTQAVTHFDAQGSKKVPADAMLIILNRVGFPIDDDQSIILFGACLDQDGKVDYDAFLNIVDYRQDLTADLESALSDEKLAKLTKESAYTTYYDRHDGTFNSVPVKAMPTLGVPSIRSDLAAPILRRISDDVNYGDEGSSGSLVSPSISARHGVVEADYYAKRTKAQIKQILQVAKVTTDSEAFDKAWEQVQDENCEASLVAINDALSK